MNIHQESQDRVWEVHFEFFERTSAEQRAEFLSWATSGALPGCVGLQEYQLSEEEIDQILGEKAFSGSSVDEETYELIEAYQRERSTSCTLYIREDKWIEAQSLLASEEVGQWGAARPGELQEACGAWADEWKKYFKPFDVEGTSWSVVPMWMAGGEAKDAIYINPGQAFGTGQHETTYLCLKLLWKYFSEKKGEASSADGALLDFGCGTGILGVAACKLIHEQDALTSWRADFVDIETQALEESKEHHRYNALPLLQSTFMLGEDFSFAHHKYDLLLANILLNTIIEFLPQFWSSLKVSGVMILSGILGSQKQELLAALQGGGIPLSAVSFEERGDWLAASVIKVNKQS